MKDQHPLKTATFAVYQKIKGKTGPAFVAKIEPYGRSPMLFGGDTAEVVEAEARAWCDAYGAKHEPEYLASVARKRKAALAKARKAKAAAI